MPRSRRGQGHVLRNRLKRARARADAASPAERASADAAVARFSAAIRERERDHTSAVVARVSAVIRARERAGAASPPAAVARVGAAVRARREKRQATEETAAVLAREIAAAKIAAVKRHAAREIAKARREVAAAEGRAELAEARARPDSVGPAEAAGAPESDRERAWLAMGAMPPLAGLRPLASLAVAGPLGDTVGAVFPETLDALEAVDCGYCRSGANIEITRGVVTRMFCRQCQLMLAATVYADCRCGASRWVNPLGLPLAVCVTCKRRDARRRLARA